VSDLRLGLKFPVILIGDGDIALELNQQRYAHGARSADDLRQPELIVNAGLFELQPGTGPQAGQKQPYRDGVNNLGLNPHPLQV